MNIVVGLIKTMRPKQWTKNLLLFAGLLFSHNLTNTYKLKLTTVGFLLFCGISGSVYIINDILDVKKDRNHPKKRYRPIASGVVSTKTALGFLVLLLASTLYMSFKLDIHFFYVTSLYFLLITMYSFILKHVVILDVMTIALGFVLRAIGGVVIINAAMSPWLLLCTFLLALFLALNKRKAELEIKKNSRKILEEYSIDLLKDMINIVTASTVMAYSLYSFTAYDHVYMMFTIPFVVYGIFRYQYIVHKKDLGETPEAILLTDKALIVNIILWIISCISILYR
ncbi:MAG: decaprenyl-phosphate phosphoribosyltransferase [Anaeromicrobium sp.]|uniref:decaprenyl-phosphate phosphoribosyltransferase n=1 Tax=Anaeromicrobium sp. TaxID=1929132 RepID=UPI0025F096DB|nr:decaprenyl-phosphate phosphoribosyltransferase [Anaeromicrobium sp.]MCT4592731.1 decaprenyl-phosphate phosphoribosyltransferase [Anaeromicrobium sp.]